MKNIMKGILQVAVLMGFSELLNVLVRWLHLPVPGSIIGIAIVFILLQTKVIKLEWVELGANWLLAELLLFFIPSAVGIMNYIPMLEHDGVRIVVIVILSTILVMVSSGLLAGTMAKRKERHAG
ncbi:holin-like protein [Paenibacillus sp. SORGH_AS306]|uniref:CidA/LrgA family holin-like protein n=1 Tax=Paenibacillus kyungheensis TaxID=1452732 RepID=A0AAX3M1Q8_9BACL|nr:MULTISPECIES: CidA/LrgA family holin-like protein [Paenibacillus]MDQ1236135.1 holin-like protein [Paenibacillus sp. SORGH_AS_0306]MDR6108490.1 holin-like protein [Paenibacillus sp. SORGH_AS_0338]WCT55589.1 CidA/LrgA family holin-like protein [Paenibacillus kyungheensis]WDF51252.1 CidA/LrgA family holin-like protein [Paenibacillus sp. KACC 21273]